MSKCPGFYYDIGKKARDLLYRDYAAQKPQSHLRDQTLDWSFNVSFRIQEIVPGLQTVFRLVLPDYRKVELRYLHDYFGITTGTTLTVYPILKFSGVIGNNFLSLGTDLAFDTATQMLTKCNAGLSFSTPFLGASLTLNDMGDNVNATCFYAINTLTRTAIAAELMHTISRNESVLAIGTQHAPFPFTLLKARLNTNGKVGALVQQQLLSRFFVTVAGEVDANDIYRNPRVGFSVAFRP